jgi:serine/threonine protein kinase
LSTLRAANLSGNAVCSVCAYTFISAHSALTPSLKQRYQVITKVGQGGFAAVYQARDLQLRSALRAIKEMSTQQLDQGEIQKAITAFEQEAHLLAHLIHPNFPRIYDHFEEQQRWYLVLDYVDGQTLSQALSNSPQGKLPVETVIEYALQLCGALSYLHTQTPPIIFRDLKPANIMITPDHQIYLIDFGIARFFKPGQAKDTIALGSVGYAPPEQFGRAQTTPQADIYSLGATLHHLLSGRDPSDEPFVFPPLDLGSHNAMTSGIADLITRMVAIKKEERPTSVQEIQRTLSALQQISQSKQSTIIVTARQQSRNALPARKPGKPQAIVPMPPLTINPPITRLFRFTRRGTKKNGPSRLVFVIEGYPLSSMISCILTLITTSHLTLYMLSVPILGYQSGPFPLMTSCRLL